jgi:hypothetical protein
VTQTQYSGACAVDLESKAPREAPSFPLLPFVKKIFTAPTSSGRKGNEDNEGLVQLYYHFQDN